MERIFKKGCSVVFFDSLRQPHEALVTNWFHGGHDGQTLAECEQVAKDRGVTSPFFLPCCNVAWVTSDESKQDPYGNQLERATSVGYGRQQGMIPFVGMCWCWPDEIAEAMELARHAYQDAVAK